MQLTHPFALVVTGSALITVPTAMAFVKPFQHKRTRCHPASGVVAPGMVPSLRGQRFLHRPTLHHDTRNSRSEEECLLLPEPNPNFNANATSLSGVLFSKVMSGIDALYPPYELTKRNARSRSDGYWKYIERGEEPPQQLTYGEFDVDFFGILLDKSWKYFLEMEMSSTSDKVEHGKQHHVEDTPHPWEGRTFCDIGSGSGRLVLTAAALHPAWKLCRGIEILSGLHNMSVSIAKSCRRPEDDSMARQMLGMKNDEHELFALRIPCGNASDNATPLRASNNRAQYLPLAPIEFTCGSFTDPYEYVGDIDCAFCFSSCMKPDIIQDLSVAIGRQCKPGTIVITTEFPLFLHGRVDPVDNDASIPYGPYEIELLEKVDGWCWLLGGQSTAYIHRVKRSSWEDYAGPRRRPQSSLEAEAYNLVQLIENGTLTNKNDFLRRVRNSMIFHDLPPEFIPEIEEKDN